MSGRRFIMALSATLALAGLGATGAQAAFNAKNDVYKVVPGSTLKISFSDLLDNDVITPKGKTKQLLEIFGAKDNDFDKAFKSVKVDYKKGTITIVFSKNYADFTNGLSKIKYEAAPANTKKQNSIASIVFQAASVQ